MAFADLGEVRLFFTDEGSGDRTLLLVHGYSADSHDWSWQIPALAQTFRVIAVDLRGHGRSSAPAGGYSATALAADLAALLDHLGAKPVIAVGHSLGAVVVSALAVERPELVSALVCVDPAYLLPDETAAGVAPVIAMIEQAGPDAFAARLLGGFDGPGRSAALRTWQIRRAAGVEAHVLRQTIEAQMNGLALVSHARDYLARRRCPILSFYADPRRIEVEAALFGDAHSRCIGWEGSGHWLHQERPAEFNALVADWIAGLPLAPAPSE
jgi:pimeloyl-ACP methyl ester carboxylesterase